MRDPEATLDDIGIFGRRALGYLDGVTAEQFVDSVGVQDQVIRCLEVVGEAARITPPHVRERYPTVPWAQIAGIRNRLAHEYGAVDMRSVYLTATGDLPALLASIGR